YEVEVFLGPHNLIDYAEYLFGFHVSAYVDVPDLLPIRAPHPEDEGTGFRVVLHADAPESIMICYSHDTLTPLQASVYVGNEVNVPHKHGFPLGFFLSYSFGFHFNHLLVFFLCSILWKY